MNFNMKKVLYQYWEGDMPEHVKKEVDDLKNRAVLNGWQYELYDFNRLIGEITDSNVVEALKRMKKYLPVAMAASATSDFFRYWCLQFGGLYCDTDVLVRMPAGEFPKLPEEEGIYFTSEQTKTSNINTCISLAVGIQGIMFARAMTKLACDKLCACWLNSYEDCKKVAKTLIDSKFSLIGFLGPAFCRTYVPFLMRQGIKVFKLPFELSSSHDPNSLLFHYGDGTWVNGGKGNDSAQRKQKIV